MAAAWIAMQAGTLCAQQKVRTVTLFPPLNTGVNIVGTWSGNSLLEVEGEQSAAPVLRIYDQTGTQVQRVTVQIPGAAQLSILNNLFARSADGYLAVSGGAYGDDRGTCFLAVISPDGANQTVVSTYPYVPLALTFAADGTIWTAGFEKDDAGNDKGPGDGYFVIRRFDKTGKVLGGAVPRTVFPGRLAPVMGSYLVASKNRVGWFSPLAKQYREFSLDGTEMATYPVSVSSHDLAGVALCDDNNVWVSVKSAPTSSVLASLDRAHGTWSSGKTQPFVYVYGCSGTNLATSSNWDDLDWIATR
jgi:hypothetical protein